MVRAFIGVSIPEGIKGLLFPFQKKLLALPIKAKFVEPENFHISLSFLGEVTETEMKKVGDKLDEICKNYEKINIIIDGLVLVPNEKFVRVIALNIKCETLESLRKDIVKDVGGKSHPPHLTLCRLKSIDNKTVFTERKNKLSLKPIEFYIDSICIIKSVLQQNGPIYQIVHKSYFM